MNNNFLQQSQFDFQMNSSAEHVILQFTREIAQNIDNGKFTLVVFIDLLKAFDKVDHQIVLTKLKHYGVIEKTTAWLRSYLFQREHYIENHNDIKYLRSVTQGPILRLQLFLIHVNDFCFQHFTRNCRIKNLDGFERDEADAHLWRAGLLNEKEKRMTISTS